jgi:hypothetical protein
MLLRHCYAIVDGENSLFRDDRCFVAMKKLNDWQKYPLCEWRKSDETSVVDTDLDDEDFDSDLDGTISSCPSSGELYSPGGVTDVVKRVRITDEVDDESSWDENEETVEASFIDGEARIGEEEGADHNGEDDLNTPVIDAVSSDNSDDGDAISLDEGIMSIDFPGVILFSDRDRDRFGWRFSDSDLDKMQTEIDGRVMYALRDVVFMFGGEFSPDYRMKAIQYVIDFRVHVPFYHTTMVFGRKLMDDHGWNSFRSWSREWDWRLYAMRNLVEGEDPVEIVAVNICWKDDHGAATALCWCKNIIKVDDSVRDTLAYMERLTRLAETATSVLLRRDDEFMQFVSNCCSERLALATAMLTEKFVVSSAGVAFSDYFGYSSKIRIRG